MCGRLFPLGVAGRIGQDGVVKKYTHGRGKARVIIAPWRGAWVILQAEELLGEYPTPQACVDALACGEARGALPLPADLPRELQGWRASRL